MKIQQQPLSDPQQWTESEKISLNQKFSGSIPGPVTRDLYLGLGGILALLILLAQISYRKAGKKQSSARLEP